MRPLQLSPPRYDANLRALVQSVLETPGEADNELRRTIADAAASVSGRPQDVTPWAAEACEVPPEIRAWTDKVARHAYKTTDEEMAALLGKGWSQDAMFEITLAAALGAAVGRYERFLHARDGAAQARKTS